MHKRHTTFARKVNRWATKVERRGVRATYELHDRVLDNRGARKQFAAAPVVLDDVQRGVLEELHREGFCVIPAADLLGQETWERLAADGDRFIAETKEGLALEAAGKEHSLRRSTKQFLVRRSAWGVMLPPDDLWLTTAVGHRMLNLANSYLGLWGKLEYVDLWHTPMTDAPERVSSQRWHRDFNDRLLLKAFIYLNDVGLDAGPFEYVPRSFPGGELGDLWPWWPGYDGYPPDEEFAKRMEGARIETFAAPRGTMILCNTAGFHRGGYAAGADRTLATWTYCSPAALRSLSERNYTLGAELPAELGAAARFAVA